APGTAAPRPSRAPGRRRGWLWIWWRSSRSRDYNLRFAVKRLAQAPDDRVTERVHVTVAGGLRADRAHLRALHPAGHDPLEGLKVVVHVHREAVRGHALGYVNADRGDLALGRPDSRAALAQLGLHALVGEGGDQRVLQRGHVLVHALDPHDRIAHELPGAVVGHRAAAIGVADGDALGEV